MSQSKILAGKVLDGNDAVTHQAELRELIELVAKYLKRVKDAGDMALGYPPVEFRDTRKALDDRFEGSRKALLNWLLELPNWVQACHEGLGDKFSVGEAGVRQLELNDFLDAIAKHLPSSIKLQPDMKTAEGASFSNARTQLSEGFLAREQSLRQLAVGLVPTAQLAMPRQVKPLRGSREPISASESVPALSTKGVEALTKEIEALTKQLAEAGKQREKLHEEVLQLRGKQTQAQALEMQALEASLRMERLAQANVALELDKKKWLEDNAALLKTANQVESRAEIAEVELKRLRDGFEDRLREASSEIQEKLAASESEVRRLGESFALAESLIKTLKGERDAVIHRRGQLEGELAAIKQVEADLKGQIATKDHDLREAKRKTEELAGELDRTRRDLEQAKAAGGAMIDLPKEPREVLDVVGAEMEKIARQIPAGRETAKQLLSQCRAELARLADFVTRPPSVSELKAKDKAAIRRVQELFNPIRSLRAGDLAAEDAGLVRVELYLDAARRRIREWADREFKIIEVAIVPNVTIFSDLTMIDNPPFRKSPPDPDLANRVYERLQPGISVDDEIVQEAFVNRYTGYVG